VWVIDAGEPQKKNVSQGGGSFSRFCRWGALVANSVWCIGFSFLRLVVASARQKPKFFWSLGFVVQERRRCPGAASLSRSGVVVQERRRCPGAASLSRSGGLGVVVQERRPGRRCPGAEAWASLSRSGGLGVVDFFVFFLASFFGFSKKVP